jgi:hypothetical protein
VIKFIKQTAIEAGPAYGKRRMRVSLNNQGYNIGIHQTAILMKQANVVAIRPRKRDEWFNAKYGNWFDDEKYGEQHQKWRGKPKIIGGNNES